jgi:pimeloyl-ACP methyl ester carboxylesterase
MDGALSRCGPVPESVASTPFDYEVLRDPAVGSIPSVSVGRGATVVILLHQTDGNGFCGWLPFARDLAQAPGVSALAIDLCNYGKASCTKVDAGTYTDADQTDPVELAIRHAREQLHARRIVVVGASMGGSVALMSAATLPGIDAAVDLSGPVTWPGMEVVDQGRALDVPVLASTADSEGPDEVAGMREIVANSPAGSSFLPAQSGHGYALLNDGDTEPLPMNEELRDWIVALAG